MPYPMGCRAASFLQHFPGGGIHHQSKQRELNLHWRVNPEAGAAIGADHAEEAEYQRHLEIDIAAPPVVPAGNGRGDRHDTHAHGDGRLGLHVEQIHQRRHGDDGAAATEQAEYDTGDCTRNNGQENHGLIPNRFNIDIQTNTIFDVNFLERQNLVSPFRPLSQVLKGGVLEAGNHFFIP